MSQIEKDIAFVLETDKLKNIVRKTKNVSNDRYENDAEHSWHLCIMAMTLQRYSNKSVDISKVLQMLVVHDLGEIYSGDTIVHSKNDENKQNELESAKKLFSTVGTLQQEEFLTLLKEFEERETGEVLFANAIDRMEPILQNIHHNGETWKKNGISYARIVEVNKKLISEGSEALWSFLIERIDQMKVNHFVE